MQPLGEMLPSSSDNLEAICQANQLENCGPPPFADTCWLGPARWNQSFILSPPPPPPQKKSKLNSGYAKTSKYCRGTYCVNRETLTPLFFFFPSIPFCKIPVSKPTKQWNAKELSTRWTPHFLSSSGMERPMSSSLSQPDLYADRYHHRPQISQEDQDVILELLCQCVVSLVPMTLDVSSQVSD